MLDFSRQNQHIALYRALRAMGANKVIQLRNRALIRGRQRVAAACTAEMIAQHGWPVSAWDKHPPLVRRAPRPWPQPQSDRCEGCDEHRVTRAYTLTWDITGHAETVHYCATCAEMVQDGHLGKGTTLVARLED